MPDTQALLTFMAAGVLLNLTPGPDVIFIVSHSLRGGLRQGLVAAWGITVGCFFHVVVAALGLGALLARSTAAFNVIKWVGAAYLMWMGGRLLLATTSPLLGMMNADRAVMTSSENERCIGRQIPQQSRDLEVFSKALATNVLNPKVALFFLAFVPQFIPADTPEPAWTFVMLGCLFNLNGFFVCMGWALASAWLMHRHQLLQRGLRDLDRLAGLMFIGFGLKLAWTNAPSS